MHAIPAIPATLLLAVATGGCHHLDQQPLGMDGDGVPCAHSAGAPAVYVDLEYSNAQATVAPCTVDRDTRITWRGPEDAGTGFTLDFTDASPEGPRAPLHYASEDSSGRQKVVLEADNEPGTYEYEYSVGGIVVDPVIIIRRVQ